MRIWKKNIDFNEIDEKHFFFFFVNKLIRATNEL